MIIENVLIKDLRPSKDRVRVTVGEEGLDALALSIKEHGQEVPIKVRPNGKGYEIIYGHRRAEASRRAGLKTIIAIVEDVDDGEALLKQILENECREDVPDIEKARGYAKLLEKLGCTQAEFASMAGISHQRISLSIRALSAVDHGVEVYNDSGGISTNHTSLVSRLHGNWDEKRKVADKINLEKLSQRQIKDVVSAYDSASSAKEKKRVLQVKHPKRKDFSFEQELRAVSMSSRREGEKRRDAELTHEPIVKDYTDAVTAYRDAIKRAMESHVRFSPEAVRFVAKKHSLIARNMLTLDEILSNV
jgi:ParB family chromosome partitioning protein